MAQKGRDLAGNENSRFLKFGHYFCPQANLIRLHTILQIQNGSGQCNGEFRVYRQKQGLFRRDLFALDSLLDGVFLAQLVMATCSFQESVIAGRCQQTFAYKRFVDITQQCFAILPQVNFPANNLNFH